MSEQQKMMLISPLDMEEVATLLADYKARYPGGAALLLLAEADREQLPALQSLARQTGYPLLGAIFPALLNRHGFFRHGVVMMPLPRAPAYTLCELADAQSRPDEAVARLLEKLAIPASEAAKATLFLIFDGMVPNVATLLDALYLQLADRVNYAGVNAGSETFQPMPCLFDSERLIGNGVLAMVLPDHCGAVLEHGYHSNQEGLAASAAEGNKVSHIEWRPALDVYQEVARRAYGVMVTRDNFYEHAVHLPFGIQRLDGEVLVRIPVALAEDGSLYCVGEVPENSLLTLLQAPQVDSAATVDHVARALAPQSFAALLLFYCAGRRMHMGNGAERELGLLSERLPGHPLVGALSLGEIGQGAAGGYPFFQNATLVACPWSSV